jgi:phospholipid-binding lipoprotein MlaA
VATVWNAVVPEPLQESLGHAFDNLGMPRRLLNNIFQLKLKGAGRELARFLINSTVGFAGFLDVARDFGLEKSNEDTGQTFGVYGVGPGPYLVLPLLPPLTLRDGVGTAIDAVMDPLNYLLPFGANVGRKAGSTVNERALSLEVFEGIEEDVFDLYTAVRSAYLQRRQRAVEE